MNGDRRRPLEQLGVACVSNSKFLFSLGPAKLADFSGSIENVTWFIGPVVLLLSVHHVENELRTRFAASSIHGYRVGQISDQITI